MKNSEEFMELMRVMALGIGSPCNPSKLENTFKSVKNETLDRKTISKYLSYMEDAFLIEKSIRYDIKGRKYIGTLSKYYFQDIGLRNALLNFRQVEENHIMENVIYNELRLRGFCVDVGMVEQGLQKNANNWKWISLQIWQTVDIISNQHLQCLMMQKESKNALH